MRAGMSLIPSFEMRVSSVQKMRVYSHLIWKSGLRCPKQRFGDGSKSSKKRVESQSFQLSCHAFGHRPSTNDKDMVLKRLALLACQRGVYHFK